jgi:replicative DNA helicase
MVDNILLQQEIIGAILLDREDTALKSVYGILRPCHFPTADYRLLFALILDLYEQSIPIDLITISNRYEGENDVTVLLSECIRNTETSANIKYHADILIEGYNKRQVEHILRTSKGNTSTELIESVSERFTEFTRQEQVKPKSLSDIMKSLKGNFFNPDVGKDGIKTGIAFIDRLIGYIDPIDVVCIAARPGVGKSALINQIVGNVTDSNKKVLYVSLEMSEEQLLNRFIASYGKIDSMRLRTATSFKDADEEILFNETAEKIEENENLFIDTESYKVKEIRHKAKSIEGLSLIAIDYLQLMTAEETYKGNRTQEVGEISRSLKKLSKELHIPIIVLSQLNRMSEAQADKEPTMAQLREAGDIEQDCSTIIMLWNKDKDDSSIKGAKVEKARQGRTGRAEMKFIGEYMQFYELEKSEQKKVSKDGFMKLQGNEELPFS